MNASMPVLRVLLVDDEPLARTRLRSLLADISHPATEVCGEAESAAQTMALLENTRPDVVLLDIHMPGMDGMQLAQRISRAGGLPQIIFVTASMDFALQAFDVAAADYLTKPVRAARLQQALLKAATALAVQQGGQALQQVAQARVDAPAGETLLIQERGLSHRLALREIVCARAEQKYVILQTRLGRDWVWDGSLTLLEEKYPGFFVRIHRSTLVQRQLLRQLKLSVQADGSEGWQVQLEGLADWLPVSRRQLVTVRQALQDP